MAMLDGRKRRSGGLVEQTLEVGEPRSLAVTAGLLFLAHGVTLTLLL
jgi:hypothetical protein